MILKQFFFLDYESLWGTYDINMFLKGLGAGALSVSHSWKVKRPLQRMGPAHPEVQPALVEWISFGVWLGY